MIVHSNCEETEADYDAGYVEEKLPAPQAIVHELSPSIEEPKGAKFSYKNASFYLPVGIVSGVLLNVLIIGAIITMKRRRARSIVNYSRMNLDPTVVGQI